jgi:glycosyltransferase 2 family protein
MTLPRRTLYVKILTIGITIILLAALSTQVSIHDIITTLTHISPIYLVAGFMLYTCSYFFRAWRFHILLNRETSIRDLFYIECVHNMMNNLLPARTGELSYVYLLKTEQNKTTGEGLATLIIARIFDFIVISIFFLLLFLFIKDLTLDVTILVATGIVLLFFMVFLLVGLLLYSNTFFKILKIITRFLNFSKFPAGDYILKKGEEIIDCVDKIKAGKINAHLSVVILSIGIWVLSYSLFYIIAVSMNIQLDAVQILFASSFAVFSTVLPIQGIGGFGTMEGGWALGFMATGVPKEIAISTGFGFHLVILVYTLSIGILGNLKIYSAGRRKKPA